MPEEVHEVIRSCQDSVRFCRGVLHEEYTGRLQVFQSCGERGSKGLFKLRILAFMAVDEAGCNFDKGPDMAPALLAKFSPHQIKRLHPVGTLIDHRNAGIAGEL